MRAVYLGNFGVSFSTENHFKKTLESLGWEVIPLQESQATAEQVLNHALKSDMFIWSKTHRWHTPGDMSMGEVLKRLEAAGIPTVGYHLDFFMGLDRWQLYQNHDYLKLQYFFTVDKKMANWITANRGRGYYLPAGVFHEEVKMIDGSKEFDVVFIGSKNYHRAWPYRPKLINWLQSTYGDRFALFGNDGSRVVRGLELNELLGKTKVVVGDSLCPNFNYPDYSSDRLWELIGRGAFMIYPEITGITDYFKDGQEVVYYMYNDFKGLKDKIDFYLENDEVRERIRRAGFERCKKEGTYRQRWEQILRIVHG